MEMAIRIGAGVWTGDREIGEVARIDEGGFGREPRVVVRTVRGFDVAFPATALRPQGEGYAIAGDAVGERLDVAGSGSGRLVVPIHVEELVAEKRVVERGMVRIERRVEEIPQGVTLDLQREEVDVERVAIGRSVDAVPEPRWEGQTLVLPVVEEEVVVTTRLVLREEVRVTRRTVTEQVSREVTTRREVLHVEQVGEDGGIEYPHLAAADADPEAGVSRS